MRRNLLLIALLLVTARPASAQLRAELVVNGLTQPLAFVQDPSDSTVQVIVQQNGRVRVLKSGVLQANSYLDLSSVVLNSGEQGLLGLAFAPDYATSGRVYMNFVNLSGNTVIARFKRSASDPLRADASTRLDLRWPDGQRFISQPFTNHKGGNLVFGPDGFLYIGMGDGGSANDPFHNAQNPLSLLGKMLRIDVNVPDSDAGGYRVPPSNPFAAQTGVLGEIWSLGLRNPWRWSFDRPERGGTGALVIADVGQGAFEEIDYEPAGRGGRNYGWRNREGAHDNVTSLPPFSQPLTEPIFEYSHAAGLSITGGFVYRGIDLGVSYRGRYFFGDFITNRIWSIKLAVNIDGSAAASDLVEHTGELGSGSNSPSSFGEDAAGELYVVSYAGAVYRVQLVNPIEAVSGRRRPAGTPILGTAVPRGGNSGTPTLSATQVATALATIATVLGHAMPEQPELALAMRSVTMRHANDRLLSDRIVDRARVRRRYRGHFDRGAAVPSAGADSRTAAVKTLGRRHRSAAW